MCWNVLDICDYNSVHIFQSQTQSSKPFVAFILRARYYYYFLINYAQIAQLAFRQLPSLIL